MWNCDIRSRIKAGEIQVGTDSEGVVREEKLGLNVFLLRAEKLVGHSYENSLRNAGHTVTVISSSKAALSLIDSMHPDMVVFDPLAEFGFAGSVHLLCADFKGPIVATGLSADSPMAERLQQLGVQLFAENAADLLKIPAGIPVNGVNTPGIDQPIKQPVVSRSIPVSKPAAPPVSTQTRTGTNRSAPDMPGHAPVLEKRFSSRWHWAVAGLGTSRVAAAIVVAIVVLLPGSNDDVTVAKALPVVPGLLLKPLVPLTIEELSGENLPLKISGIKDRSEVQEPAVAFWGDTAPDAIVTVNGDHVEVSEYGAFVVDFPLEEGANFIEIIANDFEGRTTNASFTLVRTQ
jgi:hypothetical protein